MGRTAWRILLSCLVVAPCCTGCFLFGRAPSVPKGQVLYNKYNIHYSGLGLGPGRASYLNFTNCNNHGFLPYNTELRVNTWRNGFAVVVVETGKVIGFEYDSANMGRKSVAAYLDLIMSPKPVDYTKLGPADQKGMKAGKAGVGMTKLGVMVALGYPAMNPTASLAMNEWTFGLDRSHSAKVCFDERGTVTSYDADLGFPQAIAGLDPNGPPPPPPGTAAPGAQHTADSGVSTKPSPPTHPANPVPPSSIWTPGPRQHLWALVIGIEKYEDRRIPAWPFARRDAEQVRDWLLGLGVEGLTPDKVHVLFDEQATRENVIQEIDWLSKQALPEEAVLVYFACHGAPQLAPDGTSVDAKYLVLYDTYRGKFLSTGFTVDDLTRALDRVQATTQVVVLEACYAGLTGDTPPTGDIQIEYSPIENMGKKHGRVILTASSGRQMALGSDEIQGALFTHYLLQAWGDGRRGLLSNDGFAEAKDQVRRAAVSRHSTQEPQKFGNQNIDIVLKTK